ncbi:hypothetical protein [Flavobacterium crassostreae]|uniref:Lipoprotein n=1 Tax=Flavobacterium crassostreae TaxID=1763534 RepID=A0A1B9E8W6_9FLAO|nr:hypothetical protein [Flavobacterium crassostreae]OCB78379.1 hypothetical protein LPBF_02305 [Flavobacterium crassostreae]
MPRTVNKIILLIGVLIFSGCQNNNTITTAITTTPLKKRTLLYEKYDTINSSVLIQGKNQYGQKVSGKGIIENKLGMGIVIDTDGKKKEIVMEQTSNLQINAIDEDGFEYYLKIVSKQ